jgi:hypothetical protein
VWGVELRLALDWESGLKKLGANFEHFWLVVWPPVTNKCYNIDVKILMNAQTLAPRDENSKP